MEKEVDIVALGELLIDFTEAGYGKDGMKLFEQNPGGTGFPKRMDKRI